MHDVICIGSSTIDVFVNTQDKEIRCNKRKIIGYDAGSKNIIQALNYSIGGGAVNTSVSFSRLGINVACITKLGAHGNGKIIQKFLRDEKVKIIPVRSKTEHSGYSVILDSYEHSRTILTYKGANDSLKFEEIPKKSLSSKWLYFTSMMKESFKTHIKLIDYAKKNNIKVAYNPSLYQIKEYKTSLIRLLRKIDLLIFNKEEAETLIGKFEIKKLLKKIYQKGVRIVVITDGKKGSYAYDGFRYYDAQPNIVNYVETTGAGDAFASTLLAGMIKGKSLQDSIKLATTNAESVIKQIGAQNKLLSWTKLNNIVKKKPIKVKVTK